MQWLLWVGFIVFVLVMMVLDLFVVGKKGEAVPVRKALAWTGVCVALALCFTPVLYWMYERHTWGIGAGADGLPIMGGREAASIFLQGWLLEYSLAFILAYIGVKMVLENGVAVAGLARTIDGWFGKGDIGWTGWDIHVPTWASMGVIVVSLGAGVAASLMQRKPGDTPA